MVFSPLLLLSDIYVDETTNYTAEEIINASGIKIVKMQLIIWWQP